MISSSEKIKAYKVYASLVEASKEKLNRELNEIFSAEKQRQRLKKISLLEKKIKNLTKKKSWSINDMSCYEVSLRDLRSLQSEASNFISFDPRGKAC